MRKNMNIEDDPMTVLEWFKTLWPMAAVLAAFGVRMEVGHALSKQRMKAMEKDIADEHEHTEKRIAGVHERLSRHESETKEYLREIRNDIKTLLAQK